MRKAGKTTRPRLMSFKPFNRSRNKYHLYKRNAPQTQSICMPKFVIKSRLVKSTSHYHKRCVCRHLTITRDVLIYSHLRFVFSWSDFSSQRKRSELKKSNGCICTDFHSDLRYMWTHYTQIEKCDVVWFSMRHAAVQNL